MGRFSGAVIRAGATLALLLFGTGNLTQAAGKGFQIEEASIEDLHRAIQKRQTTCQQIVQAYVDRARAYNGVCTNLVTRDGAAVAALPGALRATQTLQFPTETVGVDKLLPNFSQYSGPPIEFGRLEATASDNKVFQQFGTLVGIPNAGQLSALNTLNLRGERSVTCQAECDKSPQAGTLPANCPKVCESFRQQPDALEYAASLDAQYGRKPDLKKMPMYCVPFSFKDVFDTTDMRTTGGADVAYGLDAAPTDATLVAQLRAKGAIIYAKANLSEYNGGAGDPGGAKPKTRTFGAGARSTWGGASCNPYDTERETGGSSSGSASSVGANLVMCSICEETGGSCRQPAWRNGVVGLVTTKGLMGYGGAIGADPYLDRAGIHCKTVRDTAMVLDALKDPERGYFDPRDIYSALPKSLIPEVPYASFAVSEFKPKKGKKPLAGLRIGIVREYMVKHTANDRAMSDMANAEIKKVLRDQLGAELVESKDPAYPDDPEIADMTYTFQQALAEILPAHMPEYLVQKVEDKQIFAVPGYDISHRDYMTLASLGRAPIAEHLNIRTINSSPRTSSFSLHMAQYLALRGDPKVKDWQSLNTNSKYYVEGRTVAMQNWQNTIDIQSAGITQRVKMRDVMRMVVNKVMQQNNLDILVNPTTTIPPAKIGYASQPSVNNRPAGRFPTSADLGIPEITVPSGFTSVIYEPKYVLNDKKDTYESAANDTQASTMANPMPVGISFWSGIGEEPTILKIASIYESATRHRKPPAAFGPVK
jgi:amidase